MQTNAFEVKVPYKNHIYILRADKAGVKAADAMAHDNRGIAAVKLMLGETQWLHFKAHHGTLGDAEAFVQRAVMLMSERVHHK